MRASTWLVAFALEFFTHYLLPTYRATRINTLSNYLFNRLPITSECSTERTVASYQQRLCPSAKCPYSFA